MSIDFMSRIVGMVLFALIGARVGLNLADFIGYPPEGGATLFALFGVLVGIILTPWITVRPFRILRRSINEMPADALLMALFGGVVGLLAALLLAYPLSLLGEPFGNLLPLLLSALGAYLGATTFAIRAREIAEVLGSRGGGVGRIKALTTQSQRQLLLDTSVLIDGRIVEISKTGFLGGVLLIPRFVLTELHQVADSSDMLRRNRGRRGLVKLNELQRNEVTVVKIIEDDIDGISEVDAKLIALAQQMEAAIVTNDYNLNKVAHAQGVDVLNINLLANAVRTIHIPGETFTIHVIQEGRDTGQGVGYLEDGTMVVIENGKAYMDRHINVTVTRLINRETGRMIFALPEGEKPRFPFNNHDTER
ncbi:MAG: PIN domain nuclease [Armatimonadetes bacterium]|nr:PIN domain nuclease [Anaerolineae bacterium]